MFDGGVKIDRSESPEIGTSKTSKGDILLGIVLGLAITLVAGLGGTLGVYLGLPTLGIVFLALSWIWRNRLLRVFAVTITTLSVVILAFFVIGNALEGGA